MTKPSRGVRHKTRNKFSHRPYYRPTLAKFLATYREGQQVVIMQEPSSHKGMPHRRYRGRSGFVIGTRGKSYIVEIQDGNSFKRIISRAEHLKAI